MATRHELEALSRGELIERALRLGIPRPEVMTRVELADEIIRRLEPDPLARKRARGWLGVARDLVASLIEQGLNMPDTAKLVRAGIPGRIVHQPPVATVTLAEIYATQGHLKRALGMLDEVLEKEPDHAAAQALRDRLARSEAEPEPPPEREPEPEYENEDEYEREHERVEPAVAEPEPTTSPDAAPAPLAEATPAPAPTFPIEHEHEAEHEAETEPEPDFLPERDSLFLLRGEGDVIHAHWELSAASWARGRERASDGALAVKLLIVEPSCVGPRATEKQLAAKAPVGSAELERISRAAHVRATLGWQSARGFLPFTVGTLIDVGKRSEPRVLWQPLTNRGGAAPEAARRRALESLSGSRG